MIKIIILTLSFISFRVSAQINYYLDDTDGDDNSSGLSPLTAWQTLAKVNSFSFNPGDSILFRRGGIWRGQLTPQSGSAGNSIVYSNYGSGAKPVFMGSLNYSDPGNWVEEGSNIWRLADSTFTDDTGNIIFDNETSVGMKKFSGEDLLSQDDFWYDNNTGKVRIYSTDNPAVFHSQIELALPYNIIDISNKSYITINGLSLKYGSRHGIQGSNTAYINIRNCDISYIGGADPYGWGRLGNGVEFWGNAHDNSVERCRIWEIYDAGVTNQNSTDIVQQYNIYYRNNIIWNCGLGSFEYWNRPAGSTTSNIYFEHNTCLYSGRGWGIQRPDKDVGGHITFYDNSAMADSIFIRNNIFYEARNSIFFMDIGWQHSLDALNFNYNCYYQPDPTDTLINIWPDIMAYDSNSFNTYQDSTGKDINTILQNPLFVDVNNYDLHLSADSPCIDAGTATAVTLDFDNIPVPQNTFYDIGAYEYDFTTTIVENERLVTPTSFQLFQNYPNPFNSQTTIRYDLPKPTRVAISIYDLKGRLVNNLVNRTEASGYRAVVWDGTDYFGKPVGAGVYLYRIDTEDFIRTRKLVLLK